MAFLFLDLVCLLHVATITNGIDYICMISLKVASIFVDLVCSVTFTNGVKYSLMISLKMDFIFMDLVCSVYGVTNPTWV